MDRQQYARACAVVESAPDLLYGKLYAANTSAPRGFSCCGLGELLLASGYNEAELEIFNRSASEVVPYWRCCDTFGLSQEHCEMITDANDRDSELSAESRKEAVLDALLDILQL